MLYHCLLVGLQDLELTTKQKLQEPELVELIEEALSDADKQLFRLLCLQPSDDSISAALEANEDLRESSPLSESDLRWQLVYQEGMKSKNAFVRDWFRFNLDLNNAMVAEICRKHAGEGPIFDPRKNIVGEMPEEVAPEVVALCRIDDLYEREKKIDALRWQWLEDRTLFSYFELENVLAYYLRAKMLYRWDLLNVEEGTRVFKELIADMKRDVKF